MMKFTRWKKKSKIVEAVKSEAIKQSFHVYFAIRVIRVRVYLHRTWTWFFVDFEWAIGVFLLHEFTIQIHNQNKHEHEGTMINESIQLRAKASSHCGMTMVGRPFQYHKNALN